MKWIAALLLSTAPALAAGVVSADVVSYDTDQSFDDVIFGLENAIIDAGLVVDHVSHVGEMLERTRADVGSEVVLFDQADVYSFCSAQLSRQVMEADPMNIMFCPYDIFVAVRHDAPETTTIGFRGFPEGEMQVIHDLLDGLARAAIGME
ncbi:DUF302 domain-containing protein [Salipiger bermudensis]|uniref:DUF302 domain-containing protein n=1 Tax=Salipiger bermudensis TaxID=344736 RepID=UPI001C99097E|nr:DUF302 domain-containing protein [Salipiger bermudensis]MBY6004139.1 DUF302 domain-containing protein [Salipiger bermudensis]